MQRLMKFLHTMGAIGLMGSMVCLIVLMSFVPDPASIAEYARIRAAMGAIATWIFLPSLGLTVISGLLAFAVTKAFHNAGWALTKLATGIVLFEGGLMAIQGPMQREADLSARTLRGEIDATSLALRLDGEWMALWILLAVATANVILGVWRPRFKRRHA